MTRILDYGGRDTQRNLTVADLRDRDRTRPPYTQVTVGTEREAAAADEADIDMLICLASAVGDVRAGAPHRFLTAAIDFGGEVTPDDLLATALTALTDGADAVITARRLEAIELLASEDIPVMGHLGFVPKKSTLLGGVRSVGKTSVEATKIWSDFRRLESAGAFGVECELIAANVMAEISDRTTLTTISLGSGPHADVIFLFMEDICGEGARTPRHARTYGDLAALHRRMHDERVAALTAFKADATAGAFPGDAEISLAAANELDAFRSSLGERPKLG